MNANPSNAERLLGSCLRPGGAEVLDHAQDLGLRPDSFESRRHQLIFAALVEIRDKGGEPDEILLAQRLEESNHFGEVGGLEAIFHIQNSVETSNHGNYFARTVRDDSLRRQARRKAQRVIEKLRDSSVDPAEALGDISEFATQLSVETEGIDQQASKNLASQIWDRIPRFRSEIPEIDLNREPSPADYRAFLKGEPIAEDGDLIAITARLKSFKTTVCNALAASIAAGREVDTMREVDTLGLTMKGDGVFLIFDTEQSEKEILVQSKAIRKRLGTNLTPDKIKVISLREYLPTTRMQVIREGIERYRDRGIAGLVVDGVTDLVGSVNDDEESSRAINFLTVAATRAEAPLFACVHLNHGDRESAGGGRGHLGKELERKSKSVLCIEKGADGIGTIYAATTRGKPIPKDEGQRIGWDKSVGMVASIRGTLAEEKFATRIEDWTRTLRDIEAKTGMLAWTHKQLVQEIADAEGVSTRTGKTRIRQFLKGKILRHDASRGNYISTLPREAAQNHHEPFKQAS